MEQHSIAKAKMLGNIKFIGNYICFAFFEIYVKFYIISNISFR